MARPGYRIVERASGAVLFHHQGMAVDADMLLRDAAAEAAALPAGRYLLNLCRDRYAFTLTFLAAVLRGQVCLLTGERNGEALARLVTGFPDCAVATDDPGQALPPALGCHL